MKRYSLFMIMLLLIVSACSKEKRSVEAGKKMQDFVIGLSAWARQQHPDFIVVPQNGPELAYTDCDPESALNSDYLAAIDGMGIEELFYNGECSPDEYRLGMLRQIGPLKRVMVSEYLTFNENVNDAFTRNLNEGFLCFPRISTNYNYTLIPDSAIHENVNDIHTLSEAQNYLYLISNSSYANKQNFLNAIAATNFDVVIIDAFFEDQLFTSDEIQQLKTKACGGQRLVLSYMDIGSAENYRYYWQDGWKLHHPSWLKKKYEGYEDEIWVEYWDSEWQDIIYGNSDSYLQKILNAGFDGVYLDNVEAYYFLYYKD